MLFNEPNHLIISDAYGVRIGTLLKYKQSKNGYTVDILWRPIGTRKTIPIDGLPRKYSSHNIPRDDEEANLTIVWALHDGQSKLKEMLTGVLKMNENDNERLLAELNRKDSVLGAERRLFDDEKEEVYKKAKKQENDLDDFFKLKQKK